MNGKPLVTSSPVVSGFCFSCAFFLSLYLPKKLNFLRAEGSADAVRSSFSSSGLLGCDAFLRDCGVIGSCEETRVRKTEAILGSQQNECGADVSRSCCRLGVHVHANGVDQLLLKSVDMQAVNRYGSLLAMVAKW